MFRVLAFLADAELPGAQLGADPPRQNVTHIQPAFVALAIVALLIIGYLVWDFLKQKIVERRERQRLERFREKLQHAPE